MKNWCCGVVVSAVLPLVILTGCGTASDTSLPQAAIQVKEQQYTQALESLQGMAPSAEVNLLRGRALLGQGDYEQASAAFRAAEHELDRFDALVVRQTADGIYLRHLDQLLESQDPARQTEVERLLQSLKVTGASQSLALKLRQAVAQAENTSVIEDPGFKGTMAAMRRVAISMARFVEEVDEVFERAYPESRTTDRSMHFSELLPQLFEADREFTYVDGWGSPLTFCSNGDLYIAVSPGRDATFEHDACYYMDHPGIRDVTDPDNDIVLGNGNFISYPRGY